MKYSSMSVRQLKSKKWQGRLRYKENGKWKELSKVFPTAKGKRDAQRQCRMWMDEMNEASSNTPQSADAEATIAEVVENYLDYQLSMGQLQASTHYIQTETLRMYIEPYIGSYGFFSMDRTAIQKWLMELNKKGFKQNTIYKGYSLLHKTYQYYVKVGDLNKNPMFGIPAPKRDNKATHLEDGKGAELMELVRETFKPTDYLYSAIPLAMYGSLRRGEICGLKWRNINFDTSIISIENAIGVGRNGAYSKQPKTKSSIRTYPIISSLRDTLKEVKEAVSGKQKDYVLGGKNFIDPQILTARFTKFAKENGLVDAYGERLTLHKLRHQFGYVGVRSGMDIVSLSAMMGHADRAMTLNIYADKSGEALEIAKDKLENMFEA